MVKYLYNLHIRKNFLNLTQKAKALKERLINATLRKETIVSERMSATRD